MLTPGLPSGGCPVTRASTRRLSGLCSVTLLWARRCSMSRCSTPPLSIGWRTGRLCVGAGRHRLRAPSPIRLRCCVLRSRSGCGPCGAESRRVSRRLRGLRGTGAPLGQGWALLRAGSALGAHGSLCGLRACPRRCRSRPTADGRGRPSGTAADTAALVNRWATAAHRERLGSRPGPACRDGGSVPAGWRLWAPTRTRPLGSMAAPAGLVLLSLSDAAGTRGSAPVLDGSSSSCSSLSGTSSGESEWARRRRMMLFGPGAPVKRA